MWIEKFNFFLSMLGNECCSGVEYWILFPFFLLNAEFQRVLCKFIFTKETWRQLLLQSFSPRNSSVQFYSTETNFATTLSAHNSFYDSISYFLLFFLMSWRPAAQSCLFSQQNHLTINFKCSMSLIFNIEFRKTFFSQSN